MVKLLILVFVISFTQALSLFVEPQSNGAVISDRFSGNKKSVKIQRRDIPTEHASENHNVLGTQLPGIFIPHPTVSLDIWNLLRTSIQNEIEKESAKVLTLIRQASELSTLKFYPKSSLNLVTLGEKNYFISKQQMMTWVDAASFCRLYNMDLVSVETREEDQLITQHLQEIGLEKIYVFTSGNKVGSATYQWINGANLVYENWGPNEPSNYTMQHCLIYYDSAWYDYNCVQSESSFICEEPYS